MKKAQQYNLNCFLVSLRIPQWMTIFAVFIHAKSYNFNTVIEITDSDIKEREKNTSNSALIEIT